MRIFLQPRSCSVSFLQFFSHISNKLVQCATFVIGPDPHKPCTSKCLINWLAVKKGEFLPKFHQHLFVSILYVWFVVWQCRDNFFCVFLSGIFGCLFQQPSVFPFTTRNIICVLQRSYVFLCVFAVIDGEIELSRSLTNRSFVS